MWGYWDSSSANSTNPLWGNRIFHDSTYSVYTIQRIPKQVLVITPEGWSNKEVFSFEELVNHRIDTCWSVDMIIRGDVSITNPNIEAREMKDFIPLLKYHTASRHIYKIDKFIKDHPL